MDDYGYLFDKRAQEEEATKLKYEIYANNKKVTSAEAIDIIGAPKGKSIFLLTPNGEIRLRIFYDNQYNFFSLSSSIFSARIRSDI